MEHRLDRLSKPALSAAAGLLIAILFTPAPLSAEHILYRYDSLGRLNHACKAQNFNAERTDYGLDSADNRSNYTNIKTDFQLFNGSSVSSGDGRFSLRMNNGNLELARNSDSGILWSTNTAGSGAYAFFQGDGNLVLYTPSGSIWHSATYMYSCAQLRVENDGNVVIRSFDDQVVWQTGTGGH